MACSGYNIIENEFITLSDGVKLSTRRWMPDSNDPVPAVFEFLPYRKRDGTTYRDEITYQHLAMNGYAGVRVDMRGCGDSTGDIQDEYVAQEQKDGVEIIEWIAAQPWCTGNVAVMGISWGGFNSLQLAFEAPPALKAIIPICFTDDRYADDVHFKGGAMLMANVTWGAEMELRNSLPPDPLITCDWKQQWIERMKTTPRLISRWISHPTRDVYWKQGSICEDFSRMKVPTLLIGGYHDAYTNAIMRTFDGLACNKRVIIGPWVHLYPHIAIPKPQWGFCTEAIRWFNCHLKNNNNGADTDGNAIFVQDIPTVGERDEVQGQWIEGAETEMKTWYLGGASKLHRNSQIGKQEIHSKETTGACTVTYFPVALSDTPRDQRKDDSLSAVFDTEVFEESCYFIGRPVIKLLVACDKPIGTLFTRLCVIGMDGSSRLVGYMPYNLNHSDDGKHETVTDIEVGQFHEIVIEQDYIGEMIHKGSKLRVALSTAFYPMCLPNPEPIIVIVDFSHSSLEMPLATSITPLKRSIPAVTSCVALPYKQDSSPYYLRTVTEESDGTQVITIVSKSGKKRYEPHDLCTEVDMVRKESIGPDDPTSAKMNIEYTAKWSRGDWYTEVNYAMEFTVDQFNMYTQERRMAKHGDEVILDQKWSTETPRVGV